MRYVAVTGVGRSSPEIDRLAEEVGRLLAGRGCVVVTGGLGGVMEAASRGAAKAGGQVLAILPGTDRRDATHHAGLVVVTGSGQGRNVAVALTGDAMIAIGAGWGTLSEIGHARKAGRPVVTLAGWQLEGVARAATPAEAVDATIAALGGDPVE
jgi:uncharacterized protein (TIGR00725 family)